MANIIQNRKAHFNYELKDKYEAGLELFGHEVKSLRAGQGNLLGAHVIIRGGEAYIVGMDIPPYQPKNLRDEYDSMRTRRLLLKKSEIMELAKAGDTKGLTIVPVVLYSKGPRLKLEIAVARGKKEYDKRESIKKKDLDREAKRKEL